MDRLSNHIREHIFKSLRMATLMPPLEALQETEWSPEFEGLMRRRLIMGAFRYGRLRDSRKPPYDRVVDMQRRLTQYVLTKNKELLVDVANLALLEFEEGDGCFLVVDDGEHCGIKGE